MYDKPKAVHFELYYRSLWIVNASNNMGLSIRWNIADRLKHLNMFHLSKQDAQEIYRVITEINKEIQKFNLHIELAEYLSKKIKESYPNLLY